MIMLVYIFGLTFRYVLGADPGAQLEEASLRRQLKGGGGGDGEFEWISFDSVPQAMMTLLLSGALLEGIAEVPLQIAEEGTPQAAVMVVLFTVFVLMAHLTILNMLIGVLCEVVTA